jgi:hypothetical protein
MISKPPLLVASLPVAITAALIGTWLVHGVVFTGVDLEGTRAGNETFICDSGLCELGSGLSWLLSGAMLTGPFVALLGVLWSRWLHQNDKLGPFSFQAVPDGEQIAEVLAVLGAGLASYWIATRGPTIEAVEVSAPNSWVSGRLDESGKDLVPTRTAWFLIGAVLFAPFAFSFGSMAGREWYGRIRRRSFDAATVENEESDLA